MLGVGGGILKFPPGDQNNQLKTMINNVGRGFYGRIANGVVGGPGHANSASRNLCELPLGSLPMKI